MLPLIDFVKLITYSFVKLVYNERPQSGNLKSRGVNNKRDGLGESANKQFLPESTNLSNI